MAGGGSAYDDRVVRARLAQAFGRLIRRQGDSGVFVVLSAAFPSRLLTAFPPGVAVRRVPLEQAIARVEERLILPGTGRWQAREAGLTEGAPSTPELMLGGPPPRAGEELE
jgi:ATP-dependent DNA helicase DinG